MKKTNMLLIIGIFSLNICLAQTSSCLEEGYVHEDRLSQFEQVLVDFETNLKSREVVDINSFNPKTENLNAPYFGFKAEMQNTENILYDFKLEQGLIMEAKEETTEILGVVQNLAVNKVTEKFNIKRTSGDPTIWVYENQIFNFYDEESILVNQVVFHSYGIKDFGMGIAKIMSFNIENNRNNDLNRNLLIKDEISLFPNPATNEINIGNCILGEPFVVKIFNSQGQMLVEKKYDNNDLIAINIKLPHMISGMYILEIDPQKEIK